MPRIMWNPQIISVHKIPPTGFNLETVTPLHSVSLIFRFILPSHLPKLLSTRNP